MPAPAGTSNTALRNRRRLVGACALLAWACGSDPATEAHGEVDFGGESPPAVQPSSPGGDQPVGPGYGEVPSPARTSWENGLRCYFLPDAGSHLAHVTLAVRAGAVYEPYDKDGLAALTARSLREGGTRALPKEALEARLHALGAEIEILAGEDAVVFHASVPAGGYTELVELLAGMILAPSLTPQGIQRERTRLLENLQQAGAGEPQAQLRWSWSQGERGDRVPRLQQIRDLSPADVTSFHGIHYRPTRAALGITGPLDRSAAEEIAMKAFAPWRADSSGPVRSHPPLPPGSIAFSAPDAAGTLSGPATVVVQIPTPPAADADLVDHEVLLDIFLGDGLGGRLGHELQAAGLSGVESRLERHIAQAGGQVVLSLTVPRDRTTAALEAARKALLSLSETSPQREELEAAVARARGGVLRACSTPARQIQRECVAGALGGGIVPVAALRRLDSLSIPLLREQLRKRRGLDAAFLVIGGRRPERPDVLTLVWPGSTVRASGSGRPESLPEGARERGTAMVQQAIRALGDPRSLAEIQAMEWKSTLRGVEALRIDETWTVRLPDRLRRVRRVLATEIQTVVQGDQGSERSPRTSQELPKEECQSLMAAVRRYPVFVLSEIARDGHEVVWLHRERVDARDWEVVEVRPKGRAPFRLTIDRESGLLRRVTGTVWRTGRGEVEAEEEFQDYRQVGKVRMPHRVLLFVENEFHSESVLWDLRRIDPPPDASFSAAVPGR